MPVYFQRPENALKRANEFIEVGKREPALDALYDVIKSKKHRTWQNKIHEPILFKYLELCVDLRRSHVAKEGLYQYKLICQQVNIASLEDVIRYFLKLAEDRAEAARQESREKVPVVEDLDQIMTPESILLSFVSGEDTQDRTDRVMLTPWVKFLWEAYRNVLELLRNNVRVEKLYHDTAQQAFKFCLKYSRRTEFRKLCDNLRNHLNNAIKHQGQPNTVNLTNPETLQLHLETRLAQLESAINMELWQEAFKAVEDVYGLMQLSKRSPKPQVMANYYQKVALVFWKAENYLFHAATLHRLYVLSKEQRRTMTAEENQKMASRVLLSTLAIPIPVSLSETEKHLELDENAREKSRRLANLLGLQNIPTRSSLVNDMLKMNVQQHIMPQLQDLYHFLERDFSPLKLCARVNVFFEFLVNNEELELSDYVKPLQEVSIARLLKQVSQVYQTMQFSRLQALVPFATEFQLERAIVDIALENELQVRIDHKTKAISFGLDLHVAHKEEVPEGPYLQSMPSERLRNQLTLMSSALHQAISKIHPDTIKENCQEEQQRIVQTYLRNSKKEHKQMLERKTVIEARKEYLESLHVKREKEEQKMLLLQQKESRQAEKKRLDEERQKREVLRHKQELQEIEKKQAMDKIAALKKTSVGAKALKDLTDEEIKAMNPDAILARQVEQLDKEKKELQSKLKAQEKKMDYLARAMRVEEVPLLTKQYEDQLVSDKQFWDEQEEERINKAVAEHQTLVETSGRLQRMLPDKYSFIENLTKTRKAAHEEKMTEFQKHVDEVRKARLEARRKERMAERKVQRRIEKEEQERKEKEEREKRERKEAEEAARKEKEDKEREYREKMAKLDEIERKKREREKEIEEREKDKDQGGLGYRDMDRDRDRFGPPDRGDRDWRDDPRGAPPLRRDERERMGWRRDEPPRDRDSDYDGRPRDRDSGGGWRRGASDLRDERSRDSGQGGARRRDEQDGPRDEGSSWRKPGDRDEPQRRDLYRGRLEDRRLDDRWMDDRRRMDDRRMDDRRMDDRRMDDRGRMDDRRMDDRGSGWRRDDRDRPPSSGWRDRDREERDRAPASSWRGRDDRQRDERDRQSGGWRDGGDRMGGWGRRDRDERERSSGDGWRSGDRLNREREDRYRGDRDVDRFRGDSDRDDRYRDERENDRSDWRSDRVDDRGGDRDGGTRGDEPGRDQWRREPPPARTEGKSWSASRRGRERPPAEQSDPEGWTTVQYK
ncbi:eukaryotic translation initiation factor 3 subunit A-like [Acropora palmata]|uniref:eukaryotic translation initiation factor 3 subunit A-like n=1 Tax=Acropora palmata TaxID=6131 RepID=UPI003DA04DD9